MCILIAGASVAVALVTVTLVALILIASNLMTSSRCRSVALVAVALMVLVTVALITVASVLVAAIIVTVVAAPLAALPVALLLLLLFASRFLLAQGLVQQPGIVLGMLLKVFEGDAIIRELRIARELIVLLDDLLRRSADFALGSGGVEDAVDHISDGSVAVRLRPRS